MEPRRYALLKLLKLRRPKIKGVAIKGVRYWMSLRGPAVPLWFTAMAEGVRSQHWLPISRVDTMSKRVGASHPAWGYSDVIIKKMKYVLSTLRVDINFWSVARKRGYCGWSKQRYLRFGIRPWQKWCSRNHVCPCPELIPCFSLWPEWDVEGVFAFDRGRRGLFDRFRRVPIRSHCFWDTHYDRNTSVVATSAHGPCSGLLGQSELWGGGHRVHQMAGFRNVSLLEDTTMFAWVPVSPSPELIPCPMSMFLKDTLWPKHFFGRNGCLRALFDVWVITTSGGPKCCSPGRCDHGRSFPGSGLLVWSTNLICFCSKNRQWWADTDEIRTHICTKNCLFGK